jgi:hypothetical protein
MISILCGNIGSGKTLAMSVFAFARWCEGARVYSNYGLGFPHERLEMLRDLKSVGEPPNFFALDELWKIIDSRSSVANMFATSGILESRKRGIDIMATAQFYGSVDLRFRGLCNLVMFPEITNWFEDEYGQEWPLEVTLDKHVPADLDRVGDSIGKFSVPLLYDKCYLPMLFDTKEITEKMGDGQMDEVQELIGLYSDTGFKSSAALKVDMELKEYEAGRVRNVRNIGKAAAFIIGKVKAAASAAG